MRPILLVDDSEDDTLAIRATLKKADVSNPVLVLSDGAKAIAYLKGEDFYADRNLFPLPGVILLDLKMPVRNGFEVLEWWRDQPHLQNILMVVLSGYHDMVSVNRAYSLGARTFLIKPFKVEDILNLKQAFATYLNHIGPPTSTNGVHEPPVA